MLDGAPVRIVEQGRTSATQHRRSDAAREFAHARRRVTAARRLPAVRISDIRQPDLFQRLVHRLYIAEYGPGLQIVDDSAGDRGNDGYDPARRLLLAVYCPEKDMTEAKSLAKAARLANVPGYGFDTWVFVTPAALPEKVQATLRAEAEAPAVAVAHPRLREVAQATA